MEKTGQKDLWWRKLTFPFCRLCVMLALICFISIGCEEKITYTVNNPKDPNTTWRTEKPLSYSEAVANAHCPISLPPEARSIQFVDFYAGYGGFIEYVRFEAPVDVCRQHAIKVIKDHNSKATMESERVSTASNPMTSELVQTVAKNAKEQGEEVSRAQWFDADAIQKGEVWGNGDSHTPEKFVDVEKGIFYYRRSD